MAESLALYPVQFDDEPENYDTLVEQEPIERPTRMSDPTECPAQTQSDHPRRRQRCRTTSRLGSTSGFSWQIDKIARGLSKRQPFRI